MRQGGRNEKRNEKRKEQKGKGTNSNIILIRNTCRRHNQKQF